ncbi:MAG: SURF1 family protein [Alphaproteobacteria bacterium]|nr:SURF1 family protein [Alphaproteobacteria bacterium]
MILRIFGRSFAPRLIPAIAVAGALAVLLVLGFWQLQRMQWKHDLVARIAVQMQEAPHELRFPLAGDLHALEYRRATVSGVFMHDREIFLAARSLRGQIGYQVVTPMQTLDNHYILINRGWVPLDAMQPASRAEGQIVGPATVTGVVRLPRPRSWFQADNRPADNFWFWLDMPAIEQHASIAGLAPVILEADATGNPGGLPVGGQTRLDFPDNHFVYAITWFSLAIVLLVMYFYAHLRRET